MPSPINLPTLAYPSAKATIPASLLTTANRFRNDEVLMKRLPPLSAIVLQCICAEHLERGEELDFAALGKRGTSIRIKWG
jgi:hypothetical protein